MKKNKKHRFVAYLLVSAFILSHLLTTFFVTAHAANYVPNDTPTLTQNDIPENIQLSYVEQLGHVERLRNLETDLSTAIFRNADNTKTIYFFNEPIKYIAPNGEIRDKRTTLSALVDCYSMNDNDVKLTLPLKSTDAATLSYNNNFVSLIPITAELNDRTIRTKEYTSTNNSAILAENSVIYSNALGVDIHTKYTPSMSGFIHEIELPNREASANTLYTLETNGLTLSATRSDSLLLVDNLGTPIFQIGIVSLIDASGKTAFAKLSLTHSSSNDTHYTVAIQDTANFLTSSDTVYPVRASVPISADYSTNGAIKALNVYQYPYAGTNEYMLIGDWGSSNNPLYSKAVISFPSLYDNPFFEMLDNTTLVSLHLNLYCYISVSSPLTTPTLFNAFDGFSNDVIAYNNITINNIMGTTHASMANIGSFNSVNITGFARYWLANYDGAMNGLLMSMPDIQGYYKAYGSPYCTISERKPFLSLTYRDTALPSTPHKAIPFNTKFKLTNFLTNTTITKQTTDATLEESQLFDLVYYGSGNSVLGIPAGLYTIRACDGRYLSVTNNKEITYVNIVAGPGPTEPNLWYLVYMPNGSFSLISYKFPECALAANAASDTLCLSTLWGETSKWRLTPYGIWYSQTNGTVDNNWNTEVLDNVYFSSDLSTPVMHNASGDLMDKACSIASIAMVLRNMGATMEGIDVRDTIKKRKQLLADPFTVMMANCNTDGAMYEINEQNQIILPNNNVNHSSEELNKPYYVKWQAISDAFDVQHHIVNTPSETELREQLEANPEGVVVHFMTVSGKTHLVVFLEYDSTENDYLICDPGSEDTSEAKLVYFEQSYTYLDKNLRLTNISKSISYEPNG